MSQTWVLKVSIHCEGCKKKVKKVLQKVEGVYSIDIDSKQNRVTVNGDVDAESLIRRLLKYGKHAELLPEGNHTAANSTSSSTASHDEAKGEEKTSTIVLETEQKRHTEQGKPDVAAEAREEAANSGEVTAPKPDNDDATLNRAADKSSEFEKNNSEKQDTDTESNKGKEVRREESGEDEGPAYDSGSIAGLMPENPFMVNPQPVYTMSYSTIHPSTSYAYYEAPPAMPSTYGYSDYPPQPGYSPEYYSSESFYRSMEPAASSAGPYDMFNEENPNACNLM